MDTLTAETRKEQERQLFVRRQAECRRRRICLDNEEYIPSNKQGAHSLKRIMREIEDESLPYISRSPQELKAMIKHRKLAMPSMKYKSKLIKTLQDADHFPISDLPPELQLNIIKLAMPVDDDFSIVTPGKLPPILQASRQFQTDGTPIYYRQTRFCIKLTRFGTFNNKTSAWLNHLSTEDIRNIRHVRFVSHDEEVTFDVDLGNSDLNSWLMLDDHTGPECPCQGPLGETIPQIRQRYTESARNIGRKLPASELESLAEHMALIYSALDEHTNNIRESLEKFQTLCGSGTFVRPTIDGISILAKATAGFFEGVTGFYLNDSEEDEEEEE